MNYYKEIKNELVNNEVYKRVKDYSKNRHELESYYRVGKLLIDAQGGDARAKYGDGLIREYSKKLVQEVGRKYNYKTLLKIRQFYLFSEKFSTVSRQLTWSHYIELLKFDDINVINYYIDISLKYNLSVRELRDKIKSNEYERLDENTRNKLISDKEDSVGDLIKHPIMIKNKYGTDEISEIMLKQLILEDIENFLVELGNGFTFIKSEYKILVGDRYNYIDILLFNIEFNCYVVIELKVTELRKQHIGQIELYMNYIDKNIKKVYHDKTVGIIIVRKDNKFVMEYCSNPSIFNTTYELV